jgi:hypothetical protein
VPLADGWSVSSDDDELQPATSVTAATITAIEARRAKFAVLTRDTSSPCKAMGRSTTRNAATDTSPHSTGR